jgi:hypothetical protein
MSPSRPRSATAPTTTLPPLLAEELAKLEARRGARRESKMRWKIWTACPTKA